MIRLRKLNEEEIIINDDQIECIQMIPETKIIMMNKEFYIVADSVEAVLQKIIEYKRKVLEPLRVKGTKMEQAALEE